MGVPPALLLIVGVFVLVGGPDEGNAEIALLAVHRHFLMLHHHRGSWVLLSWSEEIKRVMFHFRRRRKESIKLSTHM